jgi:hypothetical protein
VGMHQLSDDRQYAVLFSTLHDNTSVQWTEPVCFTHATLCRLGFRCLGSHSFIQNAGI